MASILQKLFGRRGTAPDGGSPAVSLGLFGKHPAWNDFCDDIGLDTQRLIELKRLLFQGVDANTAPWDQLHAQQRLDAFRHLLLWTVGDGAVVGRLWASSDGKGRTRYPMAACADCRGLPLEAVLGHVPAALEQVQRDCEAARTQEAVYAAAETHRAMLRRWAQAGAAAADPALAPAAAASRLLACSQLGEGGKGLVSMLYRLDQEAPDSPTWDRAPSSSGGETRTIVFRPAYVRVPACSDAPADSALLWARFLEAVVSRRASRLVFVPLGERWADLIVGEPTGASLYCLRANEKGVPLTSDIPYAIDPAFAQKAAEFLASFAGADGGAGQKL